MRELTEIYTWFEKENIFLLERQLPFSEERSKAVTIQLPHNGTIGVFLDRRSMTQAEERAALLHEGGHCATGTTHSVCSPCDLIEKHEHKANKWAVKKAVSKAELEAARKAGCRNLYELADYFGLPESFMAKIVCWYDHGNLDVEFYYPDSA